jgi:hypothetical protein
MVGTKEQCGASDGGTCWKLPSWCFIVPPKVGGPVPTCASPSACIDKCEAIISGVPWYEDFSCP